MKLQRFKIGLLVLTMGLHQAAFAGCDSSCDEEKSCSNDCSLSVNTWLPRAFSSYSMHDIYQVMYTSKDSDQNLNFTLYTEYMQNFGSKCDNCKNLGSRPFWSGTNTMTVGNNDGSADLDAYQFGLGNVEVNSDGIAGVIQLDPRVRHMGTNIMMEYLQKKEERGVYFKVHAPLGAMTMEHRLKELSVANPDDELSFTQTTAAAVGNPSSDITYQWTDYPSPARRPQSISEAFYGGSGDSGELNGNLTQPIRLRYGRIAGCKLAAIRLGDITTALGYNVVANEKGFFGLGFKASLPTGNVPTADYMLEPIFGRAGLWGVGGEMSASYRLWENEAGDRSLSIHAQGEVLHLMSGRRPNFRSFDLKQNGPGSKYLLLQHYLPVYSRTTTAPEVGIQVYAPFGLEQAINITTLPVLSQFSVEGSFAFMLDFKGNGWNVALGGEFWGRSRESLCIDHHYARDLRLPNLNDYAVLGRQVSAYTIDEQPLESDTPPLNPIPTYYCEPLAKIGKSQDPVLLVGTVPNVEAPAAADLPEGIADARDPQNRIPANVSDALDIAGAQAGRAFTGKVNGLIGYTWSECHRSPSLALTGGAEFTNKTNNAVQYWSVGLVGSLNF